MKGISGRTGAGWLKSFVVVGDGFKVGTGVTRFTGGVGIECRGDVGSGTGNKTEIGTGKIDGDRVAKVNVGGMDLDIKVGGGQIDPWLAPPNRLG